MSDVEAQRGGWPTYICRDLEGGIGDVHRGFGCGVDMSSN